MQSLMRRKVSANCSVQIGMPAWLLVYAAVIMYGLSAFHHDSNLRIPEADYA